MKMTKLLHGGDYNPDQWLENPEVLEADIRFMKEAYINCVSLGIFSWTALEPSEGRFQMEWLKEVIEKLYENGISTILATPTGAMPHWLTADYPEVLQVNENGTRNLPGKRHNFCYTSPVMREKTAIINKRLSKEFGENPAVILWHLSNEYGGNFGDSACHCQHCQKEFRLWLKERYGSLEALNHAWWTGFWSHTYTDWEQLHSPVPHGENLVHGLNLDWKRFVSLKIMEFCQEEINAVRTYSQLPVTTNFMDFFKSIDYYRFQECLDLISWDSYPEWHYGQDEIHPAVRAAANHGIMRSMKGKPFLLMESTPSCVNWKPFNPMKRPGMHELSSLQAIANGSNSVQYFQWRKSRGSYEKFHGAVIGHVGENTTRVFKEVKHLGERLDALSERVVNTCNRPKIAFIFDWENWWALEDASGPRLDLNYVEIISAHYQAFWSAGVDVDFVSMDYDISHYGLVCAPFNYLYKKGYASKVEGYVKNGGCYVTTCWSGIVDENDLCFTGRHPLAEVLGLEPEEIDAPGSAYGSNVTYNGKEYAAGNICEIVKAGTAKVLAEYAGDYYKGMPAVAENGYGEGKTYYLAAEFTREFLEVFYGVLLQELALENPITDKLPRGVTMNTRIGEKDIYFLQNFNQEPVEIKLKKEVMDLVTGEKKSGVIHADGFSCTIMENCF